MAITFVTKPHAEEFNAATIDREITGTSNRKLRVESDIDITSFTDYSGDTLATTDFPHGYVTGDTVQISDNSTYAGTYEVFRITASQFSIRIPYVSNGTGTATRLNNNFKFKFDLVSDTGTVLMTKYYPCLYTSGNAAQYKINISGILRDAIEDNELPDYSATAAGASAGGSLLFYYRITEIFDDQNRLATEGDSGIDNNSGDFYLGVMMVPADTSESKCTGNICNNSETGWNLLTNRPIFVNTRTEPLILSGLFGVDNYQVKMRIVRTDTVGGTDGASTIYIPSSGYFTVPKNRKIYFPINATTAGINANTKSMLVDVIDDSGDNVSERYTVTFTAAKCNDCFLMFQNFLGEYDTMRFSNTTERALTIERENYKQSDRLRPYYVKGIESRTLTSDYLDKAQMEWIKELLLSKDVQLVDTDGSYKPVTITNKDFMIDQYRQLGRLILDIELQEQISL